jgi:hypothetical protein
MGTWCEMKKTDGHLTPPQPQHEVLGKNNQAKCGKKEF